MKVKLIKKEDAAEDTKSFYFEPQEDTSWIAGQYFYFTLTELHYPDERGPKRQFTISASPTEGHMMVTTRLKSGSGFKKTLDELPIESLIEAEGPHGTFSLEENDTTPQVFIAGGIGITPFRSIIKYTIDKNLPNNLHLIYANSTPEEIAFREELEAWTKEHENIKVDMTVSHPEESQAPWDGLSGRVDQPMLEKLVGDLGKPTFWICGPPPMVDAMDEILAKATVPTARRRIEKFTGY